MKRKEKIKEVKDVIISHMIAANDLTNEYLKEYNDKCKKVSGELAKLVTKEMKGLEDEELAGLASDIIEDGCNGKVKGDYVDMTLMAVGTKLSHSSSIEYNILGNLMVGGVIDKVSREKEK